MGNLPYRRQSTILTILWRGSELTLCLGYHDDEVAEVFGDIGKPGTELNVLTHDICRAMSKELQDGTPPQEFAARAMRGKDDGPLSLYGIIADALCVEQFGNSE